MSALDQSLDEIISSKPKRQFKKNNASKPKNGKKQVVASSSVKKATPTGPKKTNKASTSSPAVLDASYATKVVVYGLPKDIKQDAVKDFFASQVGGVQHVSLTYNERGQSKGIATVVFKSSINASKAVEKYNGAPIDGGASKLKLELIIDPTKKPLATRIIANAITAQKPAAPKKKAGAATPKKGQAAGKDNKKASKPKSKRPAKKTVEQLDQEMADYFEKKD